jgi:hypothetical protein
MYNRPTEAPKEERPETKIGSPPVPIKCRSTLAVEHALHTCEKCR